MFRAIKFTFRNRHDEKLESHGETGEKRVLS